MTALRVEGGSVSPTVSRELAALMQRASFFARGEVDGWLEHVQREGLVVETMSDVPEDLVRLLTVGWYLEPTRAGAEAASEIGEER